MPSYRLLRFPQSIAFMVISITTKYDQMYVDTFGIIQTQTLQCFPYGNKVIETDVHSTRVTPDT